MGDAGGDDIGDCHQYHHPQCLLDLPQLYNTAATITCLQTADGLESGLEVRRYGTVCHIGTSWVGCCKPYRHFPF